MSIPKNLSSDEKLRETDAPDNLNDRLSRLSPERRALLDRLRKQVRAGSAAIARRVDSTFPLSFAQERLWFLEQLAPDGFANNRPMNLVLNGPLDAACLERALAMLLDRHEVLRARIHFVNGEPVQVIADSTLVPLPLIDLSALDENARAVEIKHRVLENARASFDLRVGPLVRALLIRISEREHALLFNAHHIAFDGWSASVFVRDLAALYEAEANGTPVDLPKLAIDYADFAKWQREQLVGRRLDTLLEYWTHQLGGELRPTELASDRPRPPIQTFIGARHLFSIPEDAAEPLRLVARSERATLFMTLLAAFQTLLHRYTGDEEVVVGSPIAGRNVVETENMIGCFVNNLVLRTRFEGDPSFREVVGRVRDVALGAYAHQDLPFERLVQQMRPTRELDRSPLFQIMFQLRNHPGTSIENGGLEIRALEVDYGIARFDLAFEVVDRDNDLSCVFEYNTDLFDASTMARLEGHLRTLIVAMGAHPDEKVSALPILTEGERHQILTVWNDTASDYPSDLCIHELFEQQVDRSPDAVALVCGDERLTYAELDLRANQLAHHLRGFGVGPETLVGVCVERSPELYVALLGVLKASGAYVPLDPDYPRDRLAFYLDDAGVEVVVSTQAVADRLGEVVAGRRVVLLDTARKSIEARSAERPERGAEPRNLAYVIYTSGSTGIPKGVAIEHRSVVNLLVSMQRTVGFEAGERLLGLTTVAFDLAVPELYLPLVCGGQITVGSRELARDGEQLARALNESGPLTVQATPASWQLALEGGWHAGPVRVWCGGEALSGGLARELVARSLEVWNLYGPTETTVNSVTAKIGATEARAPVVTIGRPIANTQAFVLDRWGQLAPEGVAGELYIGGIGVARGYWRREEPTRERFVDNPFGEGRLYRTGDLARWRGCGELDYIGRADTQVKLRGFRIELGEVETALREQEGVASSCVVVKGEGGGQRLVAYVVTDAGVQVEVDNLIARLRERLPGYMVPSACIQVDAFPLTPNGKVDRRALAARTADDHRTPEALAAFEDDVERGLADIWEKLLGRRPNSRVDNFFDLGGHSLLAVRLAGEIERAFGRHIPVSKIFERPTLSHLAALIRDGVVVSGAAIPRRDDHSEVSLAEERLWLLEALAPGNAAYHTCLPLRLDGPLDLRALELAIEEILSRHETLRSRFVQTMDRPVRVVTDPEPVSLSVETIESPMGEREIVQEYAIHAVSEFFDLASGPLVRMRLLRLGPDRHLFFVVVHHIVFDGWSQGIFRRELTSLYEAFAGGAEPPLSPLPLGYADFAAWQRERVADAAFEQEHAAFWLRELEGAPAAVDLPTDRPRPAVQTFRGAKHEDSIPATTTDGLRRLAREQRATLFTVLLAGFDALLSRYMSSEDFVVGVPVAGRTHPDLEGIIGFFINMLPVRVDLSGEPTFRDLVARTRRRLVDALAHQEFPFERIVDLLHVPRDSSRTPVFQVVFQLRNFPRVTIHSSTLQIQTLPADPGTSKYDLSVDVEESSDALEMRFTYNTDLFDEETIARLTTAFRVLLDAAVADPDLRVSRLPVLAPDERRRMLADWNATATPFPRDTPLHRLFEQQVDRTPSAVAVVDGARRLTYMDLDRRANGLARALQAAGVRRGDAVGILLERSNESVVATLAVLKAGAVYVPLDLASPSERTAGMLTDACARVVVALEAKDLAGVVTTISPEMGDDSDERLTEETDAGDAAYVMFTSGSTGRPKGVCVPHRAVARLVLATNYVTFGPEKRIAHLSNPAFDAATFEVWGALLNGGQVTVVDRATALDPRALAAEFAVRGVTTTFLTAGLFNEIARANPAAFRGLEDVLFGGEAADASSVRGVLRSGAPARLMNGYGPTEGTTFTTFELVETLGTEVTNVPIGRPLANTRVYVLDANREPVPVGVPGELYIAGDGLALGYAGRDDLTAERFVDLVIGDIHERAYRTGDSVRYLADGRIVFLGRSDDQIKIRGFRVELAEIDSAMGACPAVVGVAAVAVPDTLGRVRVAAFVVPSDPAVFDPDALRDFLRRRLPDYMVPSVVSPIDALPLTPNGKVDRRALAALAIVGRVAPEVSAAPEDDVERKLAALWEALLGHGTVGRSDDFFDLGGHSLLAVRLAGEIERTFGEPLSVSVIFERPTIARLADAIRDRAGDTRSGIVRWRTAVGQPTLIYGGMKAGVLVREPALDLTFIELAYVDLAGPIDTLEELASVYVREILEIRPSGPYHFAGFCFSGRLVFEIARRLDALGHAVGLVAVIEAGGPSLAIVSESETTFRAGVRARVADRVRQDAGVGGWLRFGDHVARTRGRRALALVREYFDRLSWRARYAAQRALNRPVPQSLVAGNHYATYLLERYEPGRYEGRVDLILGRRQELHVKEARERWARVCGDLRLHRIQGWHSRIFESPEHTRALAELLRALVDEAEQ